MIPLLAPLVFILLQQPSLRAPESFTYRFDEAKRSVYRWPAGDQAKEVRVAKGEGAATGDVVRTGWLGQAIVSVPERNARFEVFAASQVKLAGGEPGVLLVVQRGRLKAFFQALLEGRQEERRVAVPGALLAVRGTRYGVEVDKHGKSILAVFEGVVEVLPQKPGMEPIRVKAGEWSTFGPDLAPHVSPMHTQGFGEHTWNQGMRPDGSMAPGAMMPGAMTKGMGSGTHHMMH